MIHKKLHGIFPKDVVKDVTLQKHEDSLKKNTCNQDLTALVTFYVSY